MEIVKNLVEEDIILSNHKLSDKEIIKAYSVLVKKLNKQIVDLEIDHDLLIDEKDQRIKKLEEQIEKFKKGEIIPVSVAEQSFKMRDKELALYKKALELACETIKDVTEDMLTHMKEKLKPPYKIKGVEYYLQQAKEKMDEQKASEKERKE